MRSIRIGSAFGVPIRLDWTFLLVLPLFAALIAWDVSQIVDLVDAALDAGIDPSAVTSGYVPWIVGFASAVGLFVGVLLHEFGHSLVALRYGYDIESITLWLLGGMANFAEFPEDWRHELVIAIAGPVVSVLVALASFGAFLATPEEFDAVRFVLGYVAVLNGALAAFNLLPGFPMDGGRILRALLSRTRPHERATRQAAAVGKAFAVLLAITGLFVNPFLVLVAIFVFLAASSEAQRTEFEETFEGVAVHDVMTPQEDLSTISADASVAELFAQMFQARHVGYPVIRNGGLVGIVTLDDVAGLPPEERASYRVEDVMTADVRTIGPDADAVTAFRRLQDADVGRLPVVDDQDTLVGIVSRTDLVRALDVIRAGRQPGVTEESVSNVGTGR